MFSRAEEARAPNRLDKSRVRLCPVQLSGRSQSSVQRKCEYHLLTHLCLISLLIHYYVCPKHKANVVRSSSSAIFAIFDLASGSDPGIHWSDGGRTTERFKTWELTKLCGPEQIRPFWSQLTLFLSEVLSI